MANPTGVDEGRLAARRTRWGLRLVAAGLLLLSTPFVAPLGVVFALCGVYLLLLGREPFGVLHARTAIIGGGFVFLAGVIAGTAVGVVQGFWQTYTGREPTGVGEAFIGYLTLSTAAGAVFGFGVLLMTYELQNTGGRVLLWCGFVAQVAAAAGVLGGPGPEIAQSLDAYYSYLFPGPGLSEFVELSAHTLPLYYILPSVMYASACLFAPAAGLKGKPRSLAPRLAPGAESPPIH